MSIDVLQEKIRKAKNPAVLELGLPAGELPPHLLAGEGSAAAAYGRFCRELLRKLRGLVPAVRVSFGAFALLGPEGIAQLPEILKEARQLGYYVVLDGPEILSPMGAEMVAQAVFGENALYPCDGLVIPGYLGSDIWKVFLPHCRDGKKDVFVVARTGNKSASELQDLLSGSRVVHAAAADHVNRYTREITGKFGYARMGILTAASAADSLRSLRGKYPKLFQLVDGYDYPSANAKNCSHAFDKFGRGAVVSAGRSITCAWQQAGTDGQDYLEQAEAAAQRMKRNLTRYVTVL